MKQLTTAQVRALSTADIVALSTLQYSVMTTAQVVALTTSQVYALETADIAALHSYHVAAFTPTQVAAMTPTQIASYLKSPIVLDLAGTGINTVSLDAGVQYDLTGTGSKQQVGWIGAGSGFLVRDLNLDGAINNGSEMFGNGTTLASGTKALDGFEALAQLDTNHDSFIDSKDTAFNELGVWVDTNSDGITQAGEVHSLYSLNITQLNLNAAHTAVNNNGNWILQDSSYVTSDGSTHQMADVWFQTGAATSPVGSASLTGEQNQALVTFPVASLSVDPLHSLGLEQIDSLSNSGVNAFSTAQVAALNPEQVSILTAPEIYTLSPDQGSSLTTGISAQQIDFAAPGGSQVLLNNTASLQDLSAAASLLPVNPLQGTLLQGQLTQNVANPGLLSPIKPELPKG